MLLAGVREISLLLFLALAIYQDLRFKKIFNHFVLIVFLSSIATALVSIGLIGGSMQVIGSLLTAITLCLPLYLTKIIGGGDFKFFCALSPLMNWQFLLNAFVISLFWAALLGVVQIILKGKLKVLLQNIKNILKGSEQQTVQVHHIPYSVAFLFGILSQFSLQKMGIHFL